VEKILDSWRFSRRRRLQYLVKWEGYLDSDNMWVDKDDVFTDDKIWEFKESNPESETHIRSTSPTKSPHSSAPTRSQLLYKHALSYMSSNGNPSSLSQSRPLVDNQGVVIPRLTPSPTPPTTLTFTQRVETPASWPPSDNMGIETHTPTYVSS
jgi:hypothetical protein